MLGRPSNVLIDLPYDGEEARAETENGAASFIVVHIDDVPSDAVERLRGVSGREPDSVHAVVTPEGEVTGLASEANVYEVEGAGDLSGLSMKIGKSLSESRGEDIFLYFSNVSRLLEDVGTMTGYRFFNALTGRLRNADGVGYFEMDRDSHDTEVNETFSTLFDASVGGRVPTPEEPTGQRS